MFTVNDMIHLKGQTPFGEGMDRVVYLDPSNHERCVKISKINFKRDFKPVGFNEIVYWLSRAGQTKYFDFNYVDVKYAESLVGRKSPDSFTHIPFCYGYVKTDLGVGVAWDYITNDDGSSCKSLKDYGDNPKILGDKEKQKIWQGLESFFNWQIQHNIMLREIAFSNTLVREERDGSFKLYHIDAIGCADLIPLAKYSEFIARLRIKSKVHRFRKRMRAWLGSPKDKTVI